MNWCVRGKKIYIVTDVLWFFFSVAAISTFLINTVVQGTLLWIGIHLIQHDKLSAGVLLAFMLYQSQLQNETQNLMNSYTSLIKSSGAGEKVFSLLDRQPPAPSTGNEESSNSIQSPTTVDNRDRNTLPEIAIASEPRSYQYHVKIHNVTFRYPTRPDNPVLTDLDLDIPAGTTVALVGKSGCGKSTIVNLLQRFYDPSAGSILIDGIDLRNLHLHDHRRRIGVVTQDPALFRGTIRDNILYGHEDASEEDMVRAAQLAHADSFIRGFPDGYDTSIGERGVQISGGQRQR
jgi:ABC-type multidrug transport system fused ATPase/permease subunit